MANRHRKIVQLCLSGKYKAKTLRYHFLRVRINYIRMTRNHQSVSKDKGNTFSGNVN